MPTTKASPARKAAARKTPSRKRTPKASAAKTFVLAQTADWIVRESLLFNDDQSPFHATISHADPALVLVTGENASGKSLLFRMLCQLAADTDRLPVSVSIRERAGTGTGDMARMRQVMMFGDESDQSTGAVSVKTVLTAFGNLDRPQGSILALDEPEMGLSDGYAHAFGQLIGQRAREVPAGCAGVMVVTHSRSLARGLCSGAGVTPTFVHVGGAPDTNPDLDTWLNTPEVHSVTELLALPELGLARFRQTHALLKQTR